MSETEHLPELAMEVDTDLSDCNSLGWPCLFLLNLSTYRLDFRVAFKPPDIPYWVLVQVHPQLLAHWLSGKRTLSAVIGGGSYIRGYSQVYLVDLRRPSEGHAVVILQMERNHKYSMHQPLLFVDIEVENAGRRVRQFLRDSNDFTFSDPRPAFGAAQAIQEHQAMWERICATNHWPVQPMQKTPNELVGA